MAQHVRIDTLLAHAGGIDPSTGGIATPLQRATTYARDDEYELPAGYLYGRYANPTVVAAERVLRELDGGADARLFASGLGAAAAVLETLSEGDRLLAPSVMYHGAQDWMRRIAARRGVRLDLFDAADPGALSEMLASGGATLVWTESPVNPTWDVVDIRAAADAAHAAGAILVVDSTAAPPITSRPLQLGADIVLHAATKYLNGHSDVLGGVLVTRQLNERWEEIGQVRKLSGATMSPADAWLLLRGLKTLSVRFARSSATALRIARFLEAHPAVDAVLYPGLESHPGHRVATRQMTAGFGGMLSFLVCGGAAEALSVVMRLRVFTRATSFGGIESLAEHRATVEGPHSIVAPNLIRLSIGLEDPEDLLEDLASALSPVGRDGERAGTARVANT